MVITRIEFSYYGSGLKDPELYVNIINDIFKQNSGVIDSKMFRQVPIKHYWNVYFTG